jgi:hypothetical protein
MIIDGIGTMHERCMKYYAGSTTCVQGVYFYPDKLEINHSNDIILLIKLCG